MYSMVKNMASAFSHAFVTSSFSCAASCVLVIPSSYPFNPHCLTALAMPLDGLDGPVHILLTKAPDSTFNLTSRGFHWIQEMPFNR